MNIFEKNLGYVEKYNSSFCAKLKNHNFSDSANFQLVNAASGDTNLVYNGIPLHCNNNPQQEALTEFQKAGKAKIVIIIGLDLGYLLKRAFIGSSCKIVMYEPDLDILRFTLETVDFEQEFQSGRVFITNSLNELNDILSAIYNYKDAINVLRLKSADQLYPEQIKNLLTELPRIDADLKANFDTLFNKSWLWLINSLYKFIPDKPDFSLNILENKFKDKAALIVSAGPSLDKNIEIIKNNREKFIIFCANVAYKKLALNDITPDFIVYIDAGDYLYTIKNLDHSKTNIINHISSFRKVFEELNPNKFFTFYCKNDIFSRWVSKFTNFSIENYEAKGSVSHLALLSAYNMGCNPIILTGQDLAYTNGKYYSSGSFWADDNEDKELLQNKIESIKKAGVFEVKGQNGETLSTSPDYAGFIKYFEEFAREKQAVKLINCSTDGAQINGFENKNLQDVSDGIEPLNLNINKVLDNIVKTEKDLVKENYENIHNQLEIFAEDLKKALVITNKGFQCSKQFHQELQKRQINSVKIKKLVNQTLILFNELENNLFKKWDFSMYIAFKELTDFYAVMDDDSGQGDFAVIKDLSGCSYNLFKLLDKRLKYILNHVLLKNTQSNG